jgi:hypothetical protein
MQNELKISVPEGYEIDKFKPTVKNEHPKMWKYFMRAVQLRVKIVIFNVTGWFLQHII